MTETAKTGNKTALLVRAMGELNRTCEKLEKGYLRLKSEASGLKKELEKKDRRVAAAFATLPMGVILADSDGKIIYSNDLALKFKKSVGNSASKPRKTIESFLGKKLAAKIKTSGQKRVSEEVRKRGVVWEVTAIPVSPKVGDGEMLLLLEDVTEKSEAQELSQRQRRLQSLGEAAAAVAHEIRNPLGSLELFTSMLAKSMDGDADSLKMLNRIRSAHSAIERAVSNFLMFASPLKPKMETFEVRRFLKELTQFCVPLAEASGIKFSTRVKENIKLSGDAQLLKQAFLNLVMNSVQAMSDGGKITIRAEKRKGGVTITFKDSGPGIKKSVGERVFDPFFTTRSLGIGLGLAITHNIITANGGSIALAPASKNGAIFKIGLQVAR